MLERKKRVGKEKNAVPRTCEEKWLKKIPKFGKRLKAIGSRS